LLARKKSSSFIGNIDKEGRIALKPRAYLYLKYKELYNLKVIISLLF